MKTKVLSLVVFLMGLFNANLTSAQFYDSESEIYFYQMLTEGGENCACVFNFDGEKATDFGFMTTLKVKNLLAKNRNHFEGQVFNAKYDVKYRSDLSDSNWVVYSKYCSGYYNTSWTTYYYFSRDRKTMVERSSLNNKEFRFSLVNKEYFEEGRRRSNLNNEVIYD